MIALRWRSPLVRYMYTLAFAAPLVLGFEPFEEKQTLSVILFDHLVYAPVRCVLKGTTTHAVACAWC